MIWAKDDPSAETIAEVDHRSTTAESDYIREGRPES